MAARSVGATGKAFTEVGRRLNLLGVLVALAAVPAVAAEPVTVLLTADTEGHVSPCSSCPAGVGLGGMARRGTTVAELRAAAPGAVLVDAGNALAGPDSVASRGKVIAAAYDALGYRVVNLTHRDLRFGRDATLAVVREAAFAAVSANLLDPSTNEPLVKPYAVVEAGGRRVAFLGLTEPPPAGLEAVPNLREQVAGVTVAPMADAVARWLPKAKAEADAVVLLYHGSPDALSAVRKQVGADVAAVLVGGMRPALLPAEGAPAVAGAAEHGKGVTRVTIDGSGAAAKVAVQLVSVAPTVVPDPKVEAVLAPFAPQDLIAAAVTANVARPAAVTTLPAALDPERIYPLGSEAANRGVRLTVVNASLATEYGGATATEGGRLLVVGTQWENIIPWTIIEERKVPTEYQVPKLSDHLYLVVNGSRVARVIPGDAAPPGHVPLKDLRLARIGDRITGNVAFQLPPDVADAAGPLELRYYDFAHGHIAVPLRAAEAPAPATRPAAAAKPLGSPVKNEVLQAAVYGAQRADNAPGHPAPPPGMQYVAVDFRATSQFTLEADATAFDPKAKPGAKMKIGTVADWTDAMRYATLLADGEYGYAAIPALSTLGESPRFLPDVPTGGTITFLAPAEAKSLAFRVDTPNAKTADGTVINPRGFYVPVEGKQPSLQAPGAMFRIRDDVFSVSVQTQRLAGEFAGVKVPAGQRFLVLGMNVANTGRVGEFFQPKDQVKLVGADAEQVEAHPATYRGPRYPAELLFIPPDENRSFEMAFPLSSQENQPRLAYNGVSMAQVYDLKKVDIDVVAATPPADQPATPNATNNAPAAPDAAPPTEVATATPAVPATPVAPPPADIRKLTAATETIKVDGKEFPARVKAKQSTKPGGIAGVGLTPDMVNGAIDRGAAALWKRVLDRLEKNGAAYGEKDIDGLLSLALVHAHYHKKNPAFDAAVRGFMAKWDPRKSGSTYENGVFCMLVEAYEDPTFAPQMRATAQWLLDQQGPEGTWGYGVADRKPADQAGQVRRALRVAGGRPPGQQPAGGAPLKRNTPWEMGADGDNSVTQYALLGLHAASRSGVKVPPETFRRLLKTTIERQHTNGGWAYTSGSGVYGSMTCAGVCAVALARHELGESAPAEHPAVERGLGWLNAHFMVDNHPESKDSWVYYYLYSLERVGRILDTEFVGGNEWYALGAQWLLGNQKDTGLWFWKDGHEAEYYAEIPTSFALMFLTRATQSLDGGRERTGPGALKTAVVKPEGQQIYMILDCSGTMQEENNGTSRFEVARQAMLNLVGELSGDTRIAVRAFGHRRPATHAEANTDTELLFPLGQPNKDAVLERLANIRPRGKTPMARTLLEAAKDLKGADPKKPITVLLVTDGGEDNTRPPKPPLAAAEDLGKIAGLRLYVVGFAVERPEWAAQLAGLAERGNGQYLPAEDGQTLLTEMRAAVLGTPENFELYDEAGKRLQVGQFGDVIRLPAAKYGLVTTFAGKRFAESLYVSPGETTAVTFDAAAIAEEMKAQDDGGAEPDAVAAPPAATATPPPAGGDANTVAPPAKRFCTLCGAPLKPDAKFCTGCGAKLSP